MKKMFGWILAMLMMMALVVPAVAEEYFPPPGDGKGVIGGRNGEAWRLGIFDQFTLKEISAPSGNPPSNTGWLYVKDKTGTSALYFEDDAGSVVQVGASSVEWDDIGDPSAAGTVAFTTYAQTLTSTKTDGDMVTIEALGAFGDYAVLHVKSSTGNPTNGTILKLTSHDADVNALEAIGNILATGDVTITGALSATTLYNAAIASAASGNVALTINASGNGAITIGGTSTGSTIFPGVVSFTGNVGIGNAASDTLTITSVIAGDVTLYDAATDSPSLIFKDATAETATFTKSDGADFAITLSSASRSLYIPTGNLKVGNGTPGTAAMNGDDAYVKGQLEVDGAVQLDGALTTAAGIAATGATVSINASSNFATNINTGSSSGALSLGGGSGTVAVASTTWDVSTAGAFSGVTGLSFATGAASTVTLASDGAGDDLTISVTGANDSSLLLASAGTGGDAIGLSATAGGITIAANKAAANQISISAAGTIAGNAVNIATTDGGIVLTAGGAANGDMTLTVGDDFSLTATGTTAITGSDWSVSATGVMAGLKKTITNDANGKTLTIAESGTVQVGTGAGVWNLPEASTCIGCYYTIVVGAIANIDINPDDADQILILTDVVGNAIRSALPGNTVTLLAIDNTNWVVVGEKGTWADIN